MVSAGLGSTAVHNFLLVANMLSTVTIDNLLVPELVQIGNSSGAILDCQFTASDNQFTLQWLFNRAEEPVYEWTPGTLPRASGVLEGRIDTAYRVSNDRNTEGRAFRIVKLSPELSGEYTCRVLSDAGEGRQTKSMLVFSPETDFVLELHSGHHDMLEINCSARGMYPQPELTLEYNSEPLHKQEQRVWRSDVWYEAKSSTHLRARSGHVTCRLEIPLAGYTALRSKQLTHIHHKPSHENIQEVGDGNKNKPNNAPANLKYFNLYASVSLTLLVYLRDLSRQVAVLS